ncbi:MAG: STAS domain-containing protein [Thermodesulfobacteriota bacterium]
MSENQSGGPVLRPGEDIVASMALRFKETLRKAAADHPGGLTIDMDGVEMVDSVGLGLLVAAHNSLAKQSGKLTLINVSQDILSLMRAMRLDKHFSVNP